MEDGTHIEEWEAEKKKRNGSNGQGNYTISPMPPALGNEESTCFDGMKTISCGTHLSFSEAERPHHRRASKYFSFTKKHGSIVILLILASEIKMLSRNHGQVVNNVNKKENKH